MRACLCGHGKSFHRKGHPHPCFLDNCSCLGYFDRRLVDYAKPTLLTMSAEEWGHHVNAANCSQDCVKAVIAFVKEIVEQARLVTELRATVTPILRAEVSGSFAKDQARTK